MNFTNEASKLLTNKYFLYFIVFLSVTNILGYLVTNKIHAVIFFALIAFLMTNFSKNMVVVLLVSLVSTSLLMANKSMREGMDNMAEGADSEVAAVEEKDEEKDEEPAAGAVEPVAPNPSESDKNSEQFGNKHASQLKNAAPVNTDGGSRIDYSTTLEGAYDNLDKILGSDGINKLTGDTQKLMAQQQKLFDSMKNMAPMIENAKEMLKGFDIKELGNLANMASGIQSKPAPAK